MKKAILITSILIASCVVGGVSYSVTFEVLHEAREINGILFPVGTRLRTGSHGEIREVEIPSEQAINGIKFHNRINFYESGLLFAGILSKNQEINGVEFKAGPSTGFALGTGVSFYESGSVLGGYLSRDQEVQGVWFLEGEWLEFHENGKVLRGKSAKIQNIRGVSFNKYDTIEISKSGEIFCNKPYDQGIAPGEIAIYFREKINEDDVEAVLAKHDSVLKKRTDSINFILISCTPTQERRISEEIKKNPLVSHAGPNVYIVAE
ncbi:MAG: hypothetical protein GY858_05250 [Candidatus Omnitrophica bacterium]|nr:hypothetical protein [Candidatus Omnitrophota bacterium]